MTPTLLVANPSCDVYGADLQMLETVAAIRARGWRVLVTSPSEGPLRDRLEALGAEVRLVDYPVLRRADGTPSGVVRLVAAALRALPRMLRVIHVASPAVVYVNTVTLPWWLLAGRLARRTTVCHVHEAEPDEKGLVRKAMSLPMHLSTKVYVNSRTSLEALCEPAPRLRSKAELVYNGVPGPETEPKPAERGTPYRLVVVGRLSPRKGPDVALEALSLLLAQGRDVTLELCGTVVPDQEWFGDQLRARAERADLAGRVTFTGYVSPVWPALERADLVVAPARAEPFGNAVVEAQLSRRPVVATAQQGHLETVIDGETGLLVPVDDARALAAAVARVMDDHDLGRTLAERGRSRALEMFSAERYRAEIADALSALG